MTLFQPEFGLLFWMLVAFLIVLGILAKYAFPVIIRSMEKRADFIDSGVKYTQEAIERKNKADDDAQALLDETHRKQLELLRESEKIKQQIIAEAKENAASEGRKLLENARKSAEQIKTDAQNDIRNEAAMLSVKIAEKILRKELANTEEQQRLVELYMEEIKKDE
ncbi:MAG: F0F1 ATP synthase subunit B [Culturomica sp.]|jgi:F-type H+-transporting ATPase subunit b|nr:F0F1 ATP synthase subunit B [Culturomica sp.]